MKINYSHDKPPKITISIDRLSVCFNDPSIENVKATCGMLLSDYKTSEIPGLKITNSAQYRVNARIPLPYLTTTADSHPIYFQAGPHLPGLPSYRLDFNPSKMSSVGISEMLTLLDSIMDPTPLEFFHAGKVTRVDVAIDLPGYTVDNLVIVNKRKKKHGVYSDRQGYPETVCFGTPRSNRLVVYTKPNKMTGELSTRIEFRLKPGCPGHKVVALSNPMKNLNLYLASVLDGLLPGVPGPIIADAIRVRGLRHALKAFPPKQKKLIKKTLIGSGSLLPNSDAIWAQWPTALGDVELGKELGVPTPQKLPPLAA